MNGISLTNNRLAIFYILISISILFHSLLSIRRKTEIVLHETHVFRLVVCIGGEAKKKKKNISETCVTCNVLCILNLRWQRDRSETMMHVCNAGVRVRFFYVNWFDYR